MADGLPDELMLVDTSLEQIDTSGVYVLRLDKHNDEVVVRHVDRLLGQPWSTYALDPGPRPNPSSCRSSTAPSAMSRFLDAS
jgi:hypothetical protein